MWKHVPILGYVDDLRAPLGPTPVDMMVSHSCLVIVRSLPALAAAARRVRRQLEAA
jgi:hypothetical protein